jgi:hypothetical protein
MKRRRRIVWAVVLLLYAVTWVGGWITHAHDLQASARAGYQRVQEYQSEWTASKPAGKELPIYLRLLEGGPATGVKWCVPLLPGVLLADSLSSLGPLLGHGGGKIVLYYGVGSVVVCDLWGWMA